MARSGKAEKLIADISDGKLGDIKRRAGEIKKDHILALELWATGEYYPAF